MANYILSATDTVRAVNATDADDTISASTTGAGWDQVHLRGFGGNDIISMNLQTTWTGSGIKHGFHAFGGTGADEFRFTNISGLTGTVSCRIDDFDLSQDKIYIGGQLLDLNNPGAITGASVSIIQYATPFHDLSNTPQQWLRIATATGQALIALEGARLLPGSDAEEAHFIQVNDTVLPNPFTTTTYEDPINFIPVSFIPTPTSGFVNHGYGSQNADTFVGAASDDRYDGDRGNDHISGGLGNDTLFGDFGNDTIVGDYGNDIIEGGKGRDTIYAGDGNDVIAGGTDNDVIFGGNGNDRIYGGSENDTLQGNAGMDFIHAGLGNDQVYGGDDNDSIFGNRGNDYLRGENGNDAIQGNDGNDTLVGGLGSDTMNGNAGSDVFIYYSPAESGPALAARDRIVNFTSGADKINLFSMDADASASGLQSFAFSNKTASANSVWWANSGSDVVIFADVNGDAIADFAIQMTNLTSISASDFIL